MKCIFKPVQGVGLVQFQPTGIGHKTKETITTTQRKETNNMKTFIIKSSHPYYVMQDPQQINQYCVMVKTSAGFSQQISPWYFRKGNAIRKYNDILRAKTIDILEHKFY